MASSGADGVAARAPIASGPGSALRTLASRSRMVLLHHLQHADRPLPVDHLARVSDLHVNTTREHLDRLVATGFVATEPEPRRERGRPRLLYRAVERPAAASLDPRVRDYLQRIAEEDQPRDGAGPDLEPRADREAARRQLAALEVHLEDLGFDPETAADELQVHLRSCPVAALARAHPELTCSVHLRLTRGVLEAEQGPLTAHRLEPFVGPEHCVLHLDSEPRVSTGEPS